MAGRMNGTRRHGKGMVAVSIAAFAITAGLSLGGLSPAGDGVLATVAYATTAYDVTDATVIDVGEMPEVKISSPGTYVITGTAAEGHITVKKGTTGVTIVLRNLDLSCSTTAPLAVNKDNGDTVVAIEGTVRLTDKEDPARDADESDEDYEGTCIKVKDGSNLIMTGTGLLTLDASADKNGIKVSDAQTLTIESGFYDITANNDGIHAGNLSILGGGIVTNAGDDGIKAEGTLDIGSDGTDGPTVLIASATEGVEGATVNMRSGRVAIHASDDGVNAANSDLTGVTFEFNSYGGTMYIDAQGDGIDSNGNINTYGGTIEVYGSANGGNAAMDVGDGGSYRWTNTEGTVLAVGYSNMAVVPSSGLYVQYGQSGMGTGMGGQPGMMEQSQAQGAPQQGQAPNQGQQAPGMRQGQSQQQGQNGSRQQFGFRGQAGQAPQGMQVGMGGQPQVASGLVAAVGGMQSGMPGMGGNQAATISEGQAIQVKDASGSIVFEGRAIRSANSVVFAYPSGNGEQSYAISIADAQSATAGTGLASLSRDEVLGGASGATQQPIQATDAETETPVEQPQPQDTPQATEADDQGQQPAQQDQQQQTQQPGQQEQQEPVISDGSQQRPRQTGDRQEANQGNKQGGGRSMLRDIIMRLMRPLFRMVRFSWR